MFNKLQDFNLKQKRRGVPTYDITLQDLILKYKDKGYNLDNEELSNYDIFKTCPLTNPDKELDSYVFNNKDNEDFDKDIAFIEKTYNICSSKMALNQDKIFFTGVSSKKLQKKRSGMDNGVFKKLRSEISKNEIDNSNMKTFIKGENMEDEGNNVVKPPVNGMLDKVVPQLNLGPIGTFKFVASKSKRSKPVSDGLYTPYIEEKFQLMDYLPSPKENSSINNNVTNKLTESTSRRSSLVKKAIINAEKDVLNNHNYISDNDNEGNSTLTSHRHFRDKQFNTMLAKASKLPTKIRLIHKKIAMAETGQNNNKRASINNELTAVKENISHIKLTEDIKNRVCGNKLNPIEHRVKNNKAVDKTDEASIRETSLPQVRRKVVLSRRSDSSDKDASLAAAAISKPTHVRNKTEYYNNIKNVKHTETETQFYDNEKSREIESIYNTIEGTINRDKKGLAEKIKGYFTKYKNDENGRLKSNNLLNFEDMRDCLKEYRKNIKSVDMNPILSEVKYVRDKRVDHRCLGKIE
jgi:hypothetical protein